MKLATILTAIVSLSVANLATAGVDDKTFFCGAHLGETIEQCAAYYRPGTPGTIATGGSTSWNGAPSGQRYVDFRNYGSPSLPGLVRDRRVLVCYQESDGKIVLVDYWNDQPLSKEQIRYLTDLNRPYGRLVTRLNNNEEFVVTTPEQDKLEAEASRPL